jgi:uncharacterized protein (DUF427 family)
VTVTVSRRHPVPAGQLTYEPSPRHVRGTIGATAIVDSKHPLLVWQPGFAVPHYAFPREEVRADLLRPAAEPPSQLGAATSYDLFIDDVTRPAIAWSYDTGDLAGHLAFDWFRRSAPGIEHWYEEDEEIFVHPRDPYKRVDAIASSRHVEVAIGGVVVAASRRPTLVFETRLPVRYYLPADDVDFALLADTTLTTGCPYKGRARYWSFTGEAVDGQVVENIAWSYPDPLTAIGPIKGLVSFYNEVVDITVDGEKLDRPDTGMIGTK